MDLIPATHDVLAPSPRKSKLKHDSWILRKAEARRIKTVRRSKKDITQVKILRFDVSDVCKKHKPLSTMVKSQEKNINLLTTDMQKL